tara:strand:- start:923 stop:1579 length:657 start_codon:yes stop_codon:yes gene_type:complete
MRIVFIFLLIVIIYSCAPRSQTYWCGDHPCINKKEKEAYFKKTMTIEVKEDNKFKSKKESEIKKIMDQARLKEKERILNEKELAKQARLEQKRKKNEEKELAKQAKLEEKQRIKQEKELAKQVRLDEKRIIKQEKELAKQAKAEEKLKIKEEKKISKEPEIDQKKISKNPKKSSEPTLEIDEVIVESKTILNSFDELVEKISRRNSLRPFPDINDIPN